MTDPIKEQAEKEAERLWRVSCPEYLSWPLIDHEDKGKWVKCDWKMLKEIFYELIEKHLREKEGLRQSLKAATDENEVLRRKVEETILYPHPKELQDEINGLNQTIKTLSSEIYKLRTSSPVHEELIAEQERSEGLEETIDQIINENHEQIKDFDIKIKALKSQLAEAKAEIERLKDNHAKSRLAWEHKKNEIHAHNLELTQALQHITDTANGDRDSFRSCSMICEYVHKQLSSPTSRKYLAMIEVVEAAKELREDNDYENCSNLIKSLRKLESEEA